MLSTKTMKAVRAALEIEVDKVSRTKAGTVVARRGFFYSNGYTAAMFAGNVAATLEAAGIKVTIINAYERWERRIGRGSHWGVEFKVLEG